MISNYKSTFLTRVLTLPTRSLTILLTIALHLLLSAPGKSIAGEQVDRSISWEGTKRTYTDTFSTVVAGCAGFDWHSVIAQVINRHFRFACSLNAMY